tara:strand:- start:688 stop:867 length:180 start_codon:yes stop_codon:yes gene_type:complete
MDFVERHYIFKYYTIFDILSKLGGFRASVLPILGAFAPVGIMLFLVSLSDIIRMKLKEK